MINEKTYNLIRNIVLWLGCSLGLCYLYATSGCVSLEGSINDVCSQDNLVFQPQSNQALPSVSNIATGSYSITYATEQDFTNYFKDLEGNGLADYSITLSELQALFPTAVTVEAVYLAMESSYYGSNEVLFSLEGIGIGNGVFEFNSTTVTKHVLEAMSKQPVKTTLTVTASLDSKETALSNVMLNSCIDLKVSVNKSL
jgi:hypothetical protein